MNGRFVLAFAFLGLALASDKSYTVKITEPATVNGTQIQPGTYKVAVANDKAILRLGKEQSEVPFKVETNAHKYDATSVKYAKENGTLHLQEIHIGGSTTKLVLGAQPTAADGQ